MMIEQMDLIQTLFGDAKKASVNSSQMADEVKQKMLGHLAATLLAEQENVITENKKDLANIPDTDAKKDRLVLNRDRITDLASSVRAIAALPDPTGRLLIDSHMPNGLHIQKKTVAMGVVGVIYESRPNVTIDVAALCLRSGNACVLRGGSDAIHTNTCLVTLIRRVLAEFELEPNMVQLMPADRKFVAEMLNAVKYIDIIIPRGSQQLIEFVRQNSKVPTIETGAGVCHTYIEQSANIDKAAAIVVNAKVTRPSVCNALDTILVDTAIAKDLLQKVAPGLEEYKVEIFADDEAHDILKEIGYPYLQEATKDDFGREFLDYKCSVKVVQGYIEAVAHISKYSSKHSEAIVSENVQIAERFLNEVDAAAVYVNASTRFTDGSVFGLGAEIGISTQKLHARGPFALEKLVTEKWFIHGDGQVR
jgi:glutamate-5-semialdehyde dehydrogenase